MGKPSRIRLIVCAMLAATGLLANSGPANAQSDGGRLDISHFYSAPALDRVPAFVRQSEAAGVFKNRRNRPPVIGFLAGLFVKYPDRMDWIGGQFEITTQTAVAAALMLSGHADRATQVADDGEWPAKVRGWLAGVPTSLMDMPIRTPSDLDILWGASFATGDPAYPRRIAKFFAGIAESGSFPIDELILVSRFRRAPKFQDYLVTLKDKYGRDSFIRLVDGATALWALGSNAKQHDFVNTMVEAEIAAAPASETAYALRRVLFRNRTELMVEGVGQSIKVMLTTTDDGPALARAAKVKLDSKEWMYKLRNEFARNEQVDIAVLLYIKPSASGHSRITVVSPSGKETQFSQPIKPAPGGKERITMATHSLPPAFLQEEGIYRVRAEFPDGPDGTFTVNNRFFVGR